MRVADVDQTSCESRLYCQIGGTSQVAYWGAHPAAQGLAREARPSSKSSINLLVEHAHSKLMNFDDRLEIFDRGSVHVSSTSRPVPKSHVPEELGSSWRRSCPRSQDALRGEHNAL